MLTHGAHEALTRIDQRCALGDAPFRLAERQRAGAQAVELSPPQALHGEPRLFLEPDRAQADCDETLNALLRGLVPEWHA